MTTAAMTHFTSGSACCGQRYILQKRHDNKRELMALLREDEVWAQKQVQNTRRRTSWLPRIDFLY
jgi:hypothetical protein